jgi:hypothetical protein
MKAVRYAHDQAAEAAGALLPRGIVVVLPYFEVGGTLARNEATTRWKASVELQDKN